LVIGWSTIRVPRLWEVSLQKDKVLHIKTGAVSRLAATGCPPCLKQEHISKCLDILQFSMGNTIVTFQDKYYEYGVNADPNCHGLTIGGFKSAFLADLKASYIFDKIN
jgi:hypothetical protein